MQDLLQVHASQSTCQLPQEACSRGLWKPEHGNGCGYSTRSEMQFQLKLNVLLLAPVVRHDAFYALLFCLAVRVYVYFSPHLSRGSTGWVGVGGGGGGGVRVGGGGGVDSVLSPCFLFHLRFDMLMMLRSIDLLLQSSTRS